MFKEIGGAQESLALAGRWTKSFGLDWRLRSRGSTHRLDQVGIRDKLP